MQNRPTEDTTTVKNLPLKYWVNQVIFVFTNSTDFSRFCYDRHCQMKTNVRNKCKKSGLLSRFSFKQVKVEHKPSSNLLYFMGYPHRHSSCLSPTVTPRPRGQGCVLRYIFILVIQRRLIRQRHKNRLFMTATIYPSLTHDCFYSYSRNFISFYPIK